MRAKKGDKEARDEKGGWGGKKNGPAICLCIRSRKYTREHKEKEKSAESELPRSEVNGGEEVLRQWRRSGCSPPSRIL